jgi:hypothetical protein
MASRLLVDWSALLPLPLLTEGPFPKACWSPFAGDQFLCNARQRAIECGYEMRTLVAQRKTARLEQITCQEMSRQRKSIGKVRPGRFYFAIP